MEAGAEEDVYDANGVDRSLIRWFLSLTPYERLAHLDTPDPALDLDFVPEGARCGVHFDAAMSNSFAFGGSNAVLVARRAAG